MKTTYSIYTINIALLVLISAFTQPLAADELYKWVDERGKVTYQSSPPPDGAAKVEKSEINLGAVEEEAESAAAFETDPIKFYTEPECSACDDARTYLEEKEVPFEEVDISENTVEAEKMERNFGHNNVPTMKVGNKSITGFQQQMLDSILRSSGYNIPVEEQAEEQTEVQAEEQAAEQAEEQAEAQAEE